MREGSYRATARALIALALLAPCSRGRAKKPDPDARQHARESLVSETTVLTDPTVADDEADPGASAAPGLERVLRPVVAQYPAILAAEQEREVAAGEQQYARGNFDPYIKGKGAWVPEGHYPTRRFEAFVNQPTYAWGTSVFAGYRYGQGHFAVYDGKAETLDRGEFRAGVTVPLLRDGYVDPKRAGLWTSRLAPQIAEASVGEKKIEIVRSVTLKYWSWVESGHALRIARYLLKLAEDRNAGIKERVERGDLAEIEYADNQRAILSRKSAIVSLERVAQGNAIELGFYLKGLTDAPDIAPDAAVPPLPEPAPEREHVLEREVDEALGRRPDIARIVAQQEQLKIELSLARNQVVPELDFTAMVAKDLGHGPERLEPLEVELGLVLDVPLTARSARGKRAQVTAKRAKLSLQAAVLRNRISADINDAMVAEATARERLGLARTELSLARRLAAAERDAFLLGNSTLLVVNLREQAVADAALKEVTALADYQRAAAVFQAVTATQPKLE